MTGQVIWFNNQKGFGFLLDKETKKEYFCHYSAIVSEGYKSLKPEQSVRFTVEQGPKGKIQAAKVEVIR